MACAGQPGKDGEWVTAGRVAFGDPEYLLQFGIAERTRSQAIGQVPDVNRPFDWQLCSMVERRLLADRERSPTLCV